MTFVSGTRRHVGVLGRRALPPIDDPMHNERDDRCAWSGLCHDPHWRQARNRHSRVHHGDARRQELDFHLVDRQEAAVDDAAEPVCVRLSYRLAVVPTETGDVHEFGILIEEQRERVGVALVPRSCEQCRDLFRRSLCGCRKLLARPSAVELDEIGPMTVQDVGGHDALGSAFRQHHDHESTCTHILDVMRQVLELFEVEGTNQRPLKLREESVVGARRVEALEILLVVQDVDVVTEESGLQ